MMSTTRNAKTHLSLTSTIVQYLGGELHNLKPLVAAIVLLCIFYPQTFISCIPSIHTIADDSTELWHYDLDSNSYGGAAVGDIDSDGKLEVIFGTYMGDESLYAINAEDGSLLWKVWAGPGPLDASVKLVDVTGDGQLEVIFATSGSYGSGAGVMHCLNGNNGSHIWYYDPDTCTDSPPAIADIDKDGELEILYGTFNDGINGGYVYILNAEDGSLAEKVGPFNGYIQSGPSVTDLDLDGQLDFVIVMFAGDDRIYAVNGSDYSTMWYFQTGGSMYHGCSFANLDNDEFPELVIGSYDGKVYAIHGENGTKYWEYDGTYANFNTAIADLDGDGYFEVVASGSQYITVLNHDGRFLWSESCGSSFRGASIADVDGNDVLDVVFGDNDGLVRALTGPSGIEIWSFDAGTDYGISPFEIDNGPILTDLDQDGSLDVFFVGGRGYSTDPENNYGRAYVLSLGTSRSQGWSMFRHDYCNSGCFNHSHLGMLRGYLTDSNNGQYLSNVEISLGSASTISNTTGFYSFQVLSGTYTISVSIPGYNEFVEEIVIFGGRITDLNISLNIETTTTTTTSSTLPTTSVSSTSTKTTTSSDIFSHYVPGLLLLGSVSGVVSILVIVKLRRKN